MKTVPILVLLILFVAASAFGGRVRVRGYYRRDGTYVRPHYRSSPDGLRSNNYGRASNRQRQMYKGYSTLPSYNNDYDNDGIANRYDYDDDNDGYSDDYDSNPYSHSSYGFSSSGKRSSSYEDIYDYYNSD